MCQSCLKMYSPIALENAEIFATVYIIIMYTGLSISKLHVVTS